MRLLRCFGEMNDDWLHRDWHEYGIDRKHGKIIVEQYEQWMEDNGIKIANLKRSSSNTNAKQPNMNAKEPNIEPDPKNKNLK